MTEQQQGRGEMGQIVRGVLSSWCREDSKTSSNVGALLVFNREDRDIATDSEVSGEYEESNPLEALAQKPPSKSCLSFPHLVNHRADMQMPAGPCQVTDIWPPPSHLPGKLLHL